MTKKDLNKTFYLIAKYWLGSLVGFIKLGNDKEEIIEIYKDRYMSYPGHDFGVTEESYQLLECNAIDLFEENK